MSAVAKRVGEDNSRVLAYAGDRRMRVEQRARPVPGPGEVLLRMRCCGLCGTDLFKIRNGTVETGTVLGHEVVGIVEATGEGVDSLSEGDRIVVPHHVACGDCALCVRGNETLCPMFQENQLIPGGFAEHILVRERAVRFAAHKVPDSISDEIALFVEPGACVLRGIHRSEILKRSQDDSFPTTAVILGGGSMGLLHLLVLKAIDSALQVVVSDPIEERLQLAVRLGADGAAFPGPATADLVRDITAGLDADAAFDTVGGSGALSNAIALTREGGTTVLFAHAREHEQAGFELNQFFKGERRIVATYSGSLSEQEEIFELLTTGHLDPSPLISHRMPFAQIDEALRLCAEQKALKILMLPDGAA